MVTRCPWVGDDPLMIAYHDTEWGVPVRDDSKLFEFLVLDAFQAGLSWRTILHKRENFRQAFSGFNPRKIASYTPERIEKLLTDPGIVRNRLKIEATITNAKAFLKLHEELGSFSDYVWGFVDDQPIVNEWQRLADIPAQTEHSLAMSRALKKRGFRFVGPTICYAFMQAAGLVNDHLVGCFRYHQLLKH